MFHDFIAAICAFISNLLRALRRTLVSVPTGWAVPFEERGLSFLEPMEEPSRRQLAVKQLKQQFLKALQADNVQEVKRILRTGKLDVDAVLEVDDPSMVLASYKEGYWLPGYKLEKSWAMVIHVCVVYNALEAAPVLLQAGAAVNRMPNGKTPLHAACEVSGGDCVALLLAHGAKADSLSLSGHTPLHYCITRGSVDCAEHLVLRGQKGNDSIERENCPL
ncbi:ankyrin repeat and SOCS box protein 4 [Brachionichthys hirsutus]|uniref:ankyrin repeat and SOCS box protein 4 n=1 Tax=Brachionichthys hirsutus TaxID=412623 RepID=UPI003604608E